MPDVMPAIRGSPTQIPNYMNASFKSEEISAQRVLGGKDAFESPARQRSGKVKTRRPMLVARVRRHNDVSKYLALGFRFLIWLAVIPACAAAQANDAAPPPCISPDYTA